MRIIIGGALLYLTSLPGAAPCQEPLDERRAAIQQSLDLLQHSEAVWRSRRDCSSCHHQALGGVALAMAAERGFVLDEDQWNAQRDWLQTEHPYSYFEDEGGINGQFGNSYRLLALAAMGRGRDDRTAAIVHYLMGRQHANGSWPSESWRPPLESSTISVTALAARAIESFAPEGRREEAQHRAARAYAWLESISPASTEEHVLRLFGLAYGGLGLESAARALLDRQREDGGWSQIPTRASDAYATGQAIVVLHEAAGLSLDTPALQAGLRWLWTHRDDAGAWHVPTRRLKKGLTQFESGFPYGKDQFISYAGSAWAVMALQLELDPRPSPWKTGKELVLARPTEPGSLLSPLYRSIVHGSLDDVRAALESGADPNELGEGKVTPLMAAIHDPALVRLLLEHGAKPDLRSQQMFLPVILAARYSGAGASFEILIEETKMQSFDLGGALAMATLGGDLECMQTLLDLGADVEFSVMDEIRPIHLACFHADVAAARLLLEAGADPDGGLKEFDGETALLAAASEGKAGMVELLLEYGADPLAVDKRGRNALHWAAAVAIGEARVAELLLAAGGIDPEVKDGDGHTAAGLAREAGNDAVSELLRR
jgi:ankyrin repeat protein